MNWVLDLNDSIEAWLHAVKVRPGRFLFSREGSLFEPSSKTGLETSTLALKLVYQLGLWDSFSQDEQQAWVTYVRSFQKEKTGYFEDQAVVKQADRRAGFWWFQRHIAVRRAETRQATAALMGVGAAPLYPVTDLPQTAEELRSTIDGYNWAKKPWHAGSQTSHLAFFYRLNGRDDLLAEVLSTLEGLQNERSGSWHLGDPPYNQKTNAAMKVLTIFQMLEMEFCYPKQLIDLALSDTDDRDACHSLDALVVVHAASRLTDHRRAEVTAFAERLLESIKLHRRDDGALSFYPDHANTTYYGLKVTKGLPESDLHGTHLLVWAITLCSELLGFEDALNWRIPVT